jgi:uncharacterized protein YegL
MDGPPIEAVNAGLKEFATALRDDPHALESAHISIMTFASGVQVLTPLTEAGSFTAPQLKASGGTSLGAALQKLGECIAADVRPKSEEHPGDWHPIVFLFTDGEPTDDWKAGLKAFKANQTALPSNVIAIGCGPSVNQTVLKEISPSVLISQDLSSERVRALFKWMSSSAKQASKAASKAAVGVGPTGTLPAQLPLPPTGFMIGL